jgi:hypothetical protein
MNAIQEVFRNISIEVWLIYSLAAFIAGGVGAVLGRLRGRLGLGFFMGLLFGPVGWLFVLLTEEGGRKCHECMSMVHPRARLCRHCGSELLPEVKRPILRGL